MDRSASKRICQFLSILVLVASVCALRSLHAQTPTADSRATTYTLTDETSPPSSGIVWGAASENYRSCDFARAGNPQCQRKITIPSNTRFYGGYYGYSNYYYRPAWNYSYNYGYGCGGSYYGYGYGYTYPSYTVYGYGW